MEEGKAIEVEDRGRQDNRKESKTVKVEEGGEQKTVEVKEEGGGEGEGGRKSGRGVGSV